MTGTVEVAQAVARIDLLDAPRAILIDAEALGAEATPVGAAVRRLLSALGLDVVALGTDAPTLTGSSVAILGREHPPVRDCHAFYVGSGARPEWMLPTAGAGPGTSVRILSLLGTGFAQERAGAAFRAAGAGRELPRSAPYDAAGILGGITQAVSAEGTTGHPPTVIPPPFDDTRRGDLLHAAAGALERCCAPNGAIAAAPPASNAQGPDYGFFWQRDAAHAAFALHALAVSGPDEALRTSARARLEGYLAFVAELGPVWAREPTAIAAGRCTMAGTPVGRYGDPQPDGPAATALVVLSVVPDPQAALAIARPFVDYLTSLDLNAPGFDLWELTVGTSFHAANLTRRALRRATEVAVAADDAAAADYRDATERWSLRINAFRDVTGGGFLHTLGSRPPWFDATSRLDMSVIGSQLLAYDVTDETVNVDDPDMTTTLRRLEDAFAARWPVNVAWRTTGKHGCGLGRFPEDCNDGIGSTGAHPWPVTTLWAAQYYLRCAQRCAHGTTPDPAAGAGEIAQARGYLAFVLAHTDIAGVSEQIDGTTGRARGARSLVWANAELVTTVMALESVDRSRTCSREGPGP